ncbi:DUF7856 family protein [Halovenus halobia]|uniref:DUF7856 family protein n=1 Tax=Halovenus halobia TaxID=3396622 RepID=UPI003F57DF67
MICRIGSVTRCGSAVRVQQDVATERLVAAVRSAEPSAKTTVDCKPPSPVHDRIGHVHAEMKLRTRTALAAAGRTRGYETPYDDDIERLERELSAVSVGETAAKSYRQELADQREETDALREAVAATRGRLAAHREHGLDTEELERELEAKVRELAEIETSATAASQQLERTREKAQTNRDRRERKFKLEDQLANRRRDARRWLVDQLESEYERAVQKLTGAQTDPYRCKPTTASLAVGKVADYDAPLVLETSPFESADAAHDWLGGPVICL